MNQKGISSIAIIIIIAFIVGGSILAYQYWWLPKQATPPQESPSIKVLSPKGGEVWEIGSAKTIKWQYSPELINRINSNSIISISISIKEIDGIHGGLTTRKDASFSDVGANSSNLLNFISYSWPVGAVSCPPGGLCQSPNAEEIFRIIPNKQYKIRICAGSEETFYAICDESAAPFSIMVQGTPSITVLSPNGGEQWELGVNHNICWRGGKDNTISAILSHQMGEVGYIFSNGSPNSCTEWDTKTVSPTRSGGAGQTIIQPGNYKIEIMDDFGNLDVSDAPFSIIPLIDISNWQTYRNEKYKLSIKYPDNWRVIDFQSETNMGTLDTFAFIPSALEGPYCNLEQKASQLIQNYKTYNPFPGYEEYARTYTKVQSCSIQVRVEENFEKFSIKDYLEKAYLPIASNKSEMETKINGLVIVKNGGIEQTRNNYAFLKYLGGMDASYLETGISGNKAQIIINTGEYVIFVSNHISQQSANNLFGKITGSLQVLR